MVHQYLVRHEAGQSGCLGVFGLYYHLEQTVHSDCLIGLDFGDVIHLGAVQAVVRGQEAAKDFVNSDLNLQQMLNRRDFDVGSIDTVRFLNVFLHSGSLILS